MRRRRNASELGEWVDLQPLEKPVLPGLPRRTKAQGPWSARTRAMWNAWKADPATARYTSADIHYAIDTAYLVEECARRPRSTLAAEIRRRMDGLGLTQSGKRGLRWRVVTEASEPARVVGIRSTANTRRDRLSGRPPCVDPALISACQETSGGAA